MNDRKNSPQQEEPEVMELTDDNLEDVAGGRGGRHQPPSAYDPQGGDKEI